LILLETGRVEKILQQELKSNLFDASKGQTKKTQVRKLDYDQISPVNKKTM